MPLTDLSLLWFHTFILPGSLASPNSVPTNLDGNKGVERRPSKAGVSRESSSVDFSKVIELQHQAEQQFFMLDGTRASLFSVWFPTSWTSLPFIGLPQIRVYESVHLITCKSCYFPLGLQKSLHLERIKSCSTK